MTSKIVRSSLSAASSSSSSPTSSYASTSTVKLICLPFCRTCKLYVDFSPFRSCLLSSRRKQSTDFNILAVLFVGYKEKNYASANHTNMQLVQPSFLLLAAFLCIVETVHHRSVHSASGDDRNASARIPHHRLYKIR